MLNVHPYQFIFSQNCALASQVTVCVSLFNYQNHIVETLRSIYQQTHFGLDLVIVEDCSTDDSLRTAEHWLSSQALRFNSVHLIQHNQNQGLSAARNTAISISKTPYVFMLDADNLLYPRCIQRCLEALETDPQAAVAYPIIEKFGEQIGLIGNVVWNRDRFKRQNCIDAMSLIRKESLIAVGGYSELKAVGKLGWEDYQLWCKFIDRGFYGVPVPEILARYRTHKTSMLNSISNQPRNIERLHREMMNLHPWLELSTHQATA
jgi:glycosyltransferase involved in cell wall biosynthesis